MIDDRFVYLGLVFVAVSGLRYILEMLGGRVKPNRVTYLLWALAPLIGFSAQLSKGVGVEALFTLSVGVVPITILMASYVVKDAYWRLHLLDFFFGGLSILGLILWLITGEGIIALVFAIVADAMAAIPTVVKSYKEPESEDAFAYLLIVPSAVITLLVADALDFAHYAFPVYIMTINIIIFSLVRFKIGQRSKTHTESTTTSS